MSKQKAIEQQLEQAILAGRWKLFERLPSERDLAEEFSVNRTTLRAAISVLASRGIVETLHGSGTRVRALPSDSPLQCSLADRLAASIQIIPCIMQACSLVIKPSQIIALERILPVAGAALRSNDAKTFVHSQIQFFTLAARYVDNCCISAALTACLPEGKSLVKLFNSCELHDCERSFAQLARILSGLRHADALETAAATQAFFSHLQMLAEQK